jgi:hypothetical protein
MEWREEILKHLETCVGLIAVVTADFLKSSWTNQEVGIILGKKKPVVSIVVDSGRLPFPRFLRTWRRRLRKRSLPGFLESRQAILTLTEDLEKAAGEAAQAIDRLLTLRSQSYEIQTYADMLLKLVSDTNLTLTTYKDSLVDPDFTQMLFDIRNYANLFDGLSTAKPAEQLNINMSLRAVTRHLDALTSLPVSMGSRYGDEFGKGAEEVVGLMNGITRILLGEIKPESPDRYSKNLRHSLQSLRNGWEMRERLFKTNQTRVLKETLRYHAFEFHRFALRPEATDLGIAAELTELSMRLHELSSTQKYFGYWWGGQILRPIEQAFSQCEMLIETIEKRIH